jgi:DNA (cytosine-5)-methyltransferase 1
VLGPDPAGGRSVTAPLKVLDLYCGVGIAGEGYTRAGFDVYGLDILGHRRNATQVVVADALSVSPRLLRLFDLVHASPPCQAHTDLKHAKNAKSHDDLIPATRALLREAGVPYVIENVEGAPLIDPVVLCGSMFDMGVDVGGTFYQLRRHRLFEASFPLAQLECIHKSPVIGIYGGHARCRSAKQGGRATRDFVGADKPALAHAAMDLSERVTMDEISQAIPPAFTHFIGKQFRAWLALGGDERGRFAA